MVHVTGAYAACECGVNKQPCHLLTASHALNHYAVCVFVPVTILEGGGTKPHTTPFDAKLWFRKSADLPVKMLLPCESE